MPARTSSSLRGLVSRSSAHASFANSIFQTILILTIRTLDRSRRATSPTSHRRWCTRRRWTRFVTTTAPMPRSSRWRATGSRTARRAAWSTGSYETRHRSGCPHGNRGCLRVPARASGRLRDADTSCCSERCVAARPVPQVTAPASTIVVASAMKRRWTSGMASSSNWLRRLSTFGVCSGRRRRRSSSSPTTYARAG